MKRLIILLTLLAIILAVGLGCGKKAEQEADKVPADVTQAEQMDSTRMDSAMVDSGVVEEATEEVEAAADSM